MSLLDLLDREITQYEFGELVGIDQSRVSRLIDAGVLARGATGRSWLVQYCDRLREQAAGRLGEGGGLDLVQERAALARSQREAQDLRNAVARGEYAPIGLLSDVLGNAASAVVDRFDLLEGALRMSCPDISDDVLMCVLAVVSSARNEWVRSTARLVDLTLCADEDDPSEEGGEEQTQDESEGDHGG